MSTVMISLILIAMVVCSFRFYIIRLSGGCCGGAGQPYIPRIKVQDHNRSHYPYHKILEVDGMSCGNCAASVENALNSIEGVWAKANLLKEEVSLYMKQDMDEAVLTFIIKDAGYSVKRREQ